MEKKRLPIGISDFKELIEKNYYFIDKSLLIEELVEKGAKVTLLPRPRRFGKTLNMSMIKYFFDIRNGEENRKLFKGLAIENTKYIEEQGKYPVIYLSFKNVKASSWEESLDKFRLEMAKVYESYKFIFETLDIVDKEIFKDICMMKSKESFLSWSLLRLSEMLYKYYGKRAIILIDECDAPLITTNDKNYYETAMDFFIKLYGAALKDNPNIEFAVMTGKMRIVDQSIFAGFNNLITETILDKKYKHFGFTEPEVKEILKYYDLDSKLEDVKKWYNGYNFGGCKVYNPCSLMNFMSIGELKSYLIKTDGDELIKNIIENSNDLVLDELKKLLNGEEISHYITDEIVFFNLKNTSKLWSLLFFTGYLTYTKESESFLDFLLNNKIYDLVIPNLEVKSFLQETFI